MKKKNHPSINQFHTKESSHIIPKDMQGKIRHKISINQLSQPFKSIYLFKQ